MDSDTKVKIITQIASASDAQLAQIAAILNQAIPVIAYPDDQRLYKFSEAAALLNVSRMTLWRMIREQKIDVVKTSLKGHRISGLALRKYVSGGNNG